MFLKSQKREKTYLLKYVHPIKTKISLMRVFAVRMEKQAIQIRPVTILIRLHNLCANAQADLNPRLVHIFAGTFSDVAPQMLALPKFNWLSTSSKMMLNGVVNAKYFYPKHIIKYCILGARYRTLA